MKFLSLLLLCSVAVAGKVNSISLPKKAAGSDGSIQISSGGNFSADPDFTFSNDTLNTPAISINGASSATQLAIAGGTLSAATPNWINLSGTYPNVAGNFHAMLSTYTATAGTNATSITGWHVNLNADNYTGTGYTRGFAVANQARSTSAFSGNPGGNIGVHVFAGDNVTATGDHAGVYVQAFAGDKLWGVVGIANDSSIARGTLHVGVVGGSLKGSGNAMGGYFFLTDQAGGNGTTNAILGPSYTGALVASNGAVAADILALYDNTTPSFRVMNGGAIATNQAVVETGAPATTAYKLPIYEASSGNLLGYVALYEDF